MTNLLNRLAQAQSDEERSWIVTESLIETLSSELQSSVWAAAIPHWFNTEVLAALRPELAAQAEQLYADLQALSFVEVFSDRGHNIHEQTRKLMLTHLWRTQRKEFLTLSNRATEYFALFDSSEARIEWLYHFVVAEQGWRNSKQWNLVKNWTKNFQRTEVETLVQRLLEQTESNRITTLGMAEVYYFLGDLEFRFYYIKLALRYYNTSLNYYREIGDRQGEANTLRTIANVLKSPINLDKLTNQTRSVLKAIFEEPSRSDILWLDVLALLDDLGKYEIIDSCICAELESNGGIKRMVLPFSSEATYLARHIISYLQKILRELGVEPD